MLYIKKLILPKISCWLLYNSPTRIVQVLPLLIVLACEKTGARQYTGTALVPPSPFSGTWISSDSDPKTSFKIFINQSRDTLWGNYCLVKDSGAFCDCPDSVQQRKQSSFVVVTNGQQPNLLETTITGYQRRHFGRLHLQIRDETLYWTVVEAPIPGDFPIKQTTFYRDTSFR